MKKIIGKTGVLLSIAASLPLFASTNSEKNYDIGMAYLNGDRGVTMVTKIMPNCPYEKCAEVLDRDGTHTFAYPRKDLSSAIKYLGLAMKENHPKAAKEVLNLLQRRLNWKEPKYDGYLIARMKEDIGFGKEEFKTNMLLSIKVLQTNGVCDGYLIGGEMYEKGYLGTKLNNVTAKSLYTKAVEVCPKDSFNGMIAGQKLKDINK